MTSRPWWRSRAQVRRLVVDAIADELFRQRRRAAARPLPWDEALSLTDDLGVDSLELLALATGLSELLHLHESGVEDFLLARRRLGDWVDVAHAGLARFSARITFRTSGSSGVPQPCVHELASLAQEIPAWARLLPGRKRILAAVPCHHIYGFLFTLLLPSVLDGDVADVVDLRASTPAWLAAAARPGDLVVGHPDFWAALARTVPELPADVMGVTSTAPCPDGLAERLEAAGLSALLQVYGSTETAGVGWRLDSDAAFTLLPHWRIDGSALVRSIDGQTRTVPSPDRLERVGRDGFRVAGRVDQGVQVGGVNVHPARVRDVLLRHPLVLDAAVRLMRPEEGSRLKAFVVPRAGTHDEVLAQLEPWIETQLTTPERPKAITVGPALPKSASGKLQDWR